MDKLKYVFRLFSVRVPPMDSSAMLLAEARVNVYILKTWGELGAPGEVPHG